MCKIEVREIVHGPETGLSTIESVSGPYPTQRSDINDCMKFTYILNSL